jgi:transposase
VEREWLTSRLEAGRSIESIAREVGRSPSTVAYWVNKYGLTSAHAAKHTAKGGIDRKALEPLVAAGMSGREIASRLGVSQATVRHWLLKHGLETQRATRRRLTGALAAAVGVTDAMAHCPRHGTTTFRRRADSGWRCLECRVEAVTARRRAVKSTLVEEAGGACVLCGYSRSAAALQFHHLDPADKTFHISQGGIARSVAVARAEAAKCVLLCANCHAEVEAGVATMPEADRVKRPIQRSPG